MSCDIAVVGAGIGGLTLALAAAQHGFSVQVFERDDDRTFRRQGFNLVLDDSTQRLLDALGLKDTRQKYAWACDSDPFGWMPLTAHVSTSPLLSKFLGTFGAVRRRQFRDTLLDSCAEAGVHVAYSHGITSLEIEDDAVRTGFEEQHSVSAKVVAGCDGINSRTRQLTLPSLELIKCGAVCVRGAAADDGSMNNFAGVPLEDSMLFFISCCPGTGFNATVFGGTITWVLEMDAGLVAEQGGVREAIAHRCGRWHPTILRLMLELTPAEGLYVETLQDLGTQTACQGVERVTLLGDAAHPVTWTGGGNSAIQDGVALAQALKDVGLCPEALRGYEEAMASRHPVSRVLQSRQDLPSYKSVPKVLWWCCWAAFRPLAFILNRTPIEHVRVASFGGYELLRW